jgi:AraC family transcriptional regulator
MLKEESLGAYRGRVARALAYVEENLSAEVSLDGAAAAACFSKYHFHRIFTAAMGESFADCVRRLRLERAANLLEQRPSMTVTEAAMAAGFSSPSVLSRLFAERFGAPPRAWREERGAVARAASRALPPAEEASPLWFGDAGQARGAAPEAAEPRLRQLPALRFASCLHIGPYGEGIGEAWARLGRWAGPRGLFGPGARAAGVSWDNPDICAPERCRYSACLEIPEGLEPSGEVLLLAFPPRSYIALRYEGPEEGLSAAYSRLYREVLPASGFEPEDDPAIEFYRTMKGGDRGFDLEIFLPVRELR